MILQPPSQCCVKLSTDFAPISAMLINMGHWHLFAESFQNEHCTSQTTLYFKCIETNFKTKQLINLKKATEETAAGMREEKTFFKYLKQHNPSPAIRLFPCGLGKDAERHDRERVRLQESNTTERIQSGQTANYSSCRKI